METITARKVWQMQDDILPDYIQNVTGLANYNSLQYTVFTFFGSAMEEVFGITHYVWAPFAFDILDPNWAVDFQYVSNNVFSTLLENSTELNPEGLPPVGPDNLRLTLGNYSVFTTTRDWVIHPYGIRASYEAGVAQAAIIDPDIIPWDTSLSELGGINGNTMENMLWWSGTTYNPFTGECYEDFTNVVPNKPTNTTLFLNGESYQDVGIIGNLISDYPQTRAVLNPITVGDQFYPDIPPSGAGNLTWIFQTNDTYTGVGESSQFPLGVVYVFLEQIPPESLLGANMMVIVCYDYGVDGTCDFNVTCSGIQPQAGDILLGVSQLAYSEVTGPGQIFSQPCVGQGTKETSPITVGITLYMWVVNYAAGQEGNMIGLWTSSRYLDGLTGYIIPYFDNFTKQ